MELSVSLILLLGVRAFTCLAQIWFKAAVLMIAVLMAAVLMAAVLMANFILVILVILILARIEVLAGKEIRNMAIKILSC